MANAQRNIQDAILRTTKALPAAGAGNNHDTIDLGAAKNTALEHAELVVELPATPSLADSKSITLTVKDSADDSTYAAISEIATIVATGAGGAGASAVTRRVRLPSATRRYIRVYQDVESSGGNNTAITVTASLRM